MRTSEKIILAIGGIITIVVTSITAIRGYRYYKLFSLKETTIEDLKKHPSNSKYDLVCISGIVGRKKSFKPKFDQTYGEIVYSKIVEKSLKKNPTITGGFFTLLDKKSQIDVMVASYSKIYMNPIYSKIEDIPLSKVPFKQLLVSFLTFWMPKRESFVEASGRITEKVIACDSTITIIGKTTTQNIIIPDYIGFSKEIILKKLRKKLKFISLVTLALWSLWLCDACMIVQEKWKEWLKKRRNKKLGEIPDTYKCIVCLENNRDTINEPCKHMCLCSSCNENLVHCPVCRAVVRGVTRIYPIDG